PGGGAAPASPRPDPRAAARAASSYLIHYGSWTESDRRIAETYPLVIVHPLGANLTRRLVADLQDGVDPDDPSDDVRVLAYVSVGEDLRTASVSDTDLRKDPRFAGNRAGPRVDPRGPRASGGPLDGIDPLGAPSPGGAGFASFYLDDNSLSLAGAADGIPDRNAFFNTCFVNAGDPAWFAALDAMTLDGPDGVAGLREIATLTFGRGLGCDGFFLDTFDTCGPNAYTDASSPNPCRFEWTAPGFRSFTARLRAAYPDKVILQNRGLFFFDPRLPHYRFSTRGLIDLVLFESFRLDSTPAADNPDPYFYPDNRYTLAPKLIAEAQRPDGFRVLSLGYAEGPAGTMSSDTLRGRSTLGLDSLLEDIRVTQEEAGFRHYLTNAPITLVNTFVRDHTDPDDRRPPVWSSTWNANAHAWPVPPGPPEPRIGLQEVEPGPASLTVRWDVALDKHPVRYKLYYQTRPFDFAGDPALASAAWTFLTPRPGRNYDRGPGPSVYPFEATLAGLTPGRTYYLLLRAVDESPRRNEDDNTTVRTGVPYGPP
ncbi:MAG TPA: hypothetical protein VNO22_09450, partial [Planctomycetota bacterium]|nr:hypothetical protein [Planctomycetota bacterium]